MNLNLFSKNKARLLISISFFILLSFYYHSAVSAMRVFQTQQVAENLIPILEPLYTGQAQFSARNNALIVRASDKILLEIEQLISTLDQPLRNLLIEVRSDLNSQSELESNGIEGHVNVGNTTIHSHNTQPSNGNITIRTGKNGSIIKTTHTRRSSSRNSPQSFKVRALEGQWANIQVGQKVPYYSNYGSNTPYYGKNKRYYPNNSYQSVELVNVDSGFDVMANILGDNRVNVKIHPKNQSLDPRYPDRINTRSIDTIVNGKLNQWIALGGSNQSLHRNNQQILSSTKHQSDLNNNYYIRVSIID